MKLYPADDCMKLLDNGWSIQIFKDIETQKYVASTIPPKMIDTLIEVDNIEEIEEIVGDILDDDKYNVQHETPSMALKMLTERILFRRN